MKLEKYQVIFPDPKVRHFDVNLHSRVSDGEMAQSKDKSVYTKSSVCKN